MPNQYKEDEMLGIFDHPVFKFQFDIAWDCPVSSFFQELENWNGQILLFETKGPAGGNPCVTAGFYSRACRDGFATDYYNMLGRHQNINPVSTEPGDVNKADWEAQLKTQDERSEPQD